MKKYTLTALGLISVLLAGSLMAANEHKHDDSNQSPAKSHAMMQMDMQKMQTMMQDMHGSKSKKEKQATMHQHMSKMKAAMANVKKMQSSTHQHGEGEMKGMMQAMDDSEVTTDRMKTMEDLMEQMMLHMEAMQQVQ